MKKWLLILLSLLTCTGVYPQDSYYMNQAKSYMRDAEYYTRQKNIDKARTYNRWAQDEMDKANTRMKWAQDAREKAATRMRWAQDAMEKAKR